MRPSEYLDALRERLKLPSDYALQPVLAVGKSAISRYRHNADTFGEPVALRVAELLQLDPARVLADMAAERAGSDAARSAWRRLAATVGAAMLAIFAAVPQDGLARPINGLGVDFSRSAECAFSAVARIVRRLALSLKLGTLSAV
jgi:hypothetical protein